MAKLSKFRLFGLQQALKVTIDVLRPCTVVISSNGLRSHGRALTQRSALDIACNPDRLTGDTVIVFMQEIRSDKVLDFLVGLKRQHKLAWVSAPAWRTHTKKVLEGWGVKCLYAAEAVELTKDFNVLEALK